MTALHTVQHGKTTLCIGFFFFVFFFVFCSRIGTALTSMQTTPPPPAHPTPGCPNYHLGLFQHIIHVQSFTYTCINVLDQFVLQLLQNILTSHVKQSVTYEPQRQKTYLLTCVPNETQINISAQSDQSLRRPHEETQQPLLFKLRSVKI